MILLPWLLSRTAYLKRHALIERARETRARVLFTVARKVKVKNPQGSFMAWTAKQSGFFSQNLFGKQYKFSFKFCQ